MTFNCLFTSVIFSFVSNVITCVVTRNTPFLINVWYFGGVSNRERHSFSRLTSYFVNKKEKLSHSIFTRVSLPYFSFNRILYYTSFQLLPKEE